MSILDIGNMYKQTPIIAHPDSLAVAADAGAVNHAIQGMTYFNASLLLIGCKLNVFLLLVGWSHFLFTWLPLAVEALKGETIIMKV